MLVFFSEEVNSCENNLLVHDMLTSGYKTGQDVQPPYSMYIQNSNSVLSVF